MRERERLPAGHAWRRMPTVLLPMRTISHSAWSNGQVKVLSSLEDAEYPDGIGGGPQFHLSISLEGHRRRPRDREVRRALRAFGVRGPIEEDNHHPGNARHFWLPLDPAHRVECQCKTDEIQRVEADGFVWSDAIDRCRGCDLQRLLGIQCPLHPPLAEALKGATT